MSTYITPNGLEKINTGTSVNDFSADTIIDLALKFNNNVEVVEEVVTTVNVLETNMDILISKGFTSGFINGGLSGEL